MSKLLVERLRLLLAGGITNPEVLSGSVDPTVGAGVAAPTGSVYLRDDGGGVGQVYSKTGGLDTAWSRLLPGAAPLLMFGHTSIAAAADTRFLTPGFTSLTATTASIGAFRSRAGTLRNFRVRHNSAVGNGNPVVYDVRINTVPSGLGLSLATAVVGDASDLATTIPVAAGDLIEATATKALSIGGGGVDVVFEMEFE